MIQGDYGSCSISTMNVTHLIDNKISKVPNQDLRLDTTNTSDQLDQISNFPLGNKVSFESRKVLPEVTNRFQYRSISLDHETTESCKPIFQTNWILFWYVAISVGLSIEQKKQSSKMLAPEKNSGKQVSPNRSCFFATLIAPLWLRSNSRHIHHLPSGPLK